MGRKREITLTLYTPTRSDSNGHDGDISDVFFELMREQYGTLSLRTSTTMDTPKIELTYKDIKITPSTGMTEILDRGTITFDAPTTFGRVDRVIRKITNPSLTEQAEPMDDVDIDGSKVSLATIPNRQPCFRCGELVADDDAESCPYCGQEF